jgi:cell division protein FtsI/penicillin-binding protein 2
MRSWTRWAGVGIAAGIIGALVPVMQGRVDIEDLKAPLRRIERKPPPEEEKKTGPDLEGLDLLKLKLHPRTVTAELTDGRTATLTLDPTLQRTAGAIMRRYEVPEAGVVLMDTRSGDVLVYASHVREGEPFDVNARAEAPAASVFKVITGSALVESGGLSATTEQCYHGGRSRITAAELRDDPQRDKWCANLAMAMGRSLNVVFARLAQKHLTPEDLSAMGGAYGFGAPVPFVVPNEAPKIEIPPDPVEFARTAAGFWNTSLSPLAGASIAQTVANGGVTLAPQIVDRVTRGDEVTWERSHQPQILRRAVKAETAKEVTQMMLQTVANGSAYKIFHDRKRHAFLPDVLVAGKTGTLTRHKENRHYTWFIGFAPADKPEVAVAALIVNTPLWRIKGPHLARDVLRAYFAKQGLPGVRAP